MESELRNLKADCARLDRTLSTREIQLARSQQTECSLREENSALRSKIEALIYEMKAPIERLPREVVARVFWFVDAKTLMMTIPSVSGRFEQGI